MTEEATGYTQGGPVDRPTLNLDPSTLRLYTDGCVLGRKSGWVCIRADAEHRIRVHKEGPA